MNQNTITGIATKMGLGGGVKLKKPATGGVWIFSGTTYSRKKAILY